MRAILLLMATTKPEFCAKQKDRKVCREDVCIEVKLLKIFFLRTYDLVLEDSSFSSEKISLVSTMYKSFKYELLLLLIHRKRWECYSFLIKINPDRLDLMFSISYSLKWLWFFKSRPRRALLTDCKFNTSWPCFEKSESFGTCFNLRLVVEKSPT